MNITIEKAIEVLAACGYECPELAEREKQIVMLRTAIDRQPYTMDKEVCEALRATADDLSGCILCDATPDCWRNLPSGGYPLYKERAK
jgi:hypothetical protein